MNPLTTMMSTEKENSGPAIQSARSHDSGRTVLYPDLYVLTNDKHWTMTPEAHNYAAAAGSFCFVTTENREQQDLYNLTTFPCVQRSLCLDEVISDSSSVQVDVRKRVDSQTRDMLERCMDTCGKAAGARAKRRSRARQEASAQEVRGYYKQFAEAKHFEWTSWIDNEVFDLVDLRKVSKSWEPFFKDSLMMSSHHDVERQLPQEAGRPPHTAARLKKHAYGMNDPPDAGGTFLTRHCVAMAWFPHEPIDALTCCILSRRVSELGNTGDKGPSHSSTAQKTPSLNHVSYQRWNLHLKKNAGSHSWKSSYRKIRGRSRQSVDDLFGTDGNDMEQRVLSKYF